MDKICQICKNKFKKSYNVSKKSWKKVKFCSVKCRIFYTKTLRRSKGTITKSGYRIISNGRGNRISEHRLIMEKFLRRKLYRNEHIHHINQNKLDNRIENLLVVTPVQHAKLHYPKGSKFGKNKIIF